MSGYTTETAPKRIWLQVNPEAMVDEETGSVEGDDEPFPGEEVTWCWHSIGGLEVEYVRADLVQDAMTKAEAALADIGDADREPGDDVAWCERRAAQALPAIRAALSVTANT